MSLEGIDETVTGEQSSVARIEPLEDTRTRRLASTSQRAHPAWSRSHRHRSPVISVPQSNLDDMTTGS